MNSHPKEDKIQIIVFGPGYGESILIHLGDRCWIIVDSCTNCQNDGESAAISHLRKIGVQVSDEVKLVAVTHWHDDHTKRLGATLKDCTSAELVLPAVFTERDFITYLQFHGDSAESNLKYSAKEIINCLKIIKDRNNKRKPDEKSFLKLALSGKEIWSKDAKDCSHNRNIVIKALSPSDMQMLDFMTELGNHLNPNSNLDKFSLENEFIRNKNEISVAILVSIGDDFSILLGSDVIIGKNMDCGWINIVNNHKGKSQKSKVYKVAHHGSESADLNEIWEILLEENPYSIVTPWMLGKEGSAIVLPKDSDKIRIKQKSYKSYLTSEGNLTQSKKFQNAKEGYRGSDLQTEFREFNECGSVILTIDLDDNQLDVQLQHGAVEL